MPDKLLKDGLRTSEKIGSVSEFAELLFVRLIVATCHAGRCPWDPVWIRSHALPNRPRKRLTEIAVALESLRRAHLVTRYTVHDGTAYLLIPNHGQRLKHAVRSPWPPPPAGQADAEGQTFMALPGGPPIAASPPPPVESEKPKVGRGHVPPLFSSSSSDSETEAQWMARLARDWPGVDLAEELREARRKKRGRLERGWFETEWLPRCSEKVGQITSPTAATAEPAGWRGALDQLFPGNIISGDPERTWASVPADVQARVLGQLKQGRAA